MVLVSHGSLILTSISTPLNNPRSPTSPLSRVYTMLIVLPRPAYVYEIVIRGAGGCRMSVSLGISGLSIMFGYTNISLGSYADPHAHVLSLHGVLIPHSNAPLIYSLPVSPFKTHGAEFLATYPHRPTRVVKLSFTYNWHSQGDVDNSKMGANGVNNDRGSATRPASPKPSGFNFSFANFGASSSDTPSKSPSKDSRPQSTHANSNNNATPLNGNQLPQPYVGVLGHPVGVLDLASTPELRSPDTPSQDDTSGTLRTSISRLSEDSMNNMCVSKTVDDIFIIYTTLF